MSATISISSASIIEGDSTNQLVFTISLSEPLAQAITFKYSTANGSATSSQDYTSVSSGTVSFNAGETVKTISITILNDNFNEVDETFLVNVFIPRNTFLNPSTLDVLAATGIGKITDTLTASSTTSLLSTIENLTLTGTANIDGTGNSGNNILTGNSGRNTLDGFSGNDTLNGGTNADTLIGGVGDDTYIIDSTDTVVEVINAGIDTVQAGYSYILGANLENLTLTGTTNLNGTGNSTNNILIGNSGNNSLNGGDGNDLLEGKAGADTLRGGIGDDIYTIDGSDTILEAANEGVDTIQAAFTYTIAASSTIENLTLIGTAKINGTGNSGNNILIGNSNSNILNGGNGNDVLDGGGGIDTLIGGAGDDVYVLDSLGDALDSTAETATGGIDTVQTVFSYVLKNNFERLVLIGDADLEGIGNGLANTITGNSGDNIIDGETGADVLAGGTGNDTYFVDNISDVVTESGGQGTDSVEASVNYLLRDNVENLTLTGTATTGTGNILSNTLIGNELNNTFSGGSGNDYLDGKAGIDTLDGGTGSDTYVVDNVGDVVSETSVLTNEIDVICAEVTFTLVNNVEHLTLLGTTNLNGFGNNLNNLIIGNVGNNSLKGDLGNDTLDGAKGRDTLQGGAGNDIYIVDNFRDAVTEALNEGIDLVESSITYELGSNLENLELTGSAVTNGTGNSLDNVIVGNGAANTLDGGSGNDSLDGGSGKDLIIGGLGDDTLNGSTGDIDTLYGGLGNDTHLVGLPEDVIVEGANEGTDTVYSTASTFTLSANLENFYLSGSGNINGTGNELNNQITGSNGANIIDGGVGRDTMTGSLGNDLYYVDNSGDIVTETSTLPTELDTVIASTSYTLTANVEKLILAGLANLGGTGNTLNNGLIGNSGNNTLRDTLRELSGNDTLDGGLGSDTLIGGTGNDTYVVDNTGDLVTENVNECIDLVFSSLTNYTLTANVENLTLTGTADINGNGNVLNNLITGNIGNNTLNGSAGDDTLSGGLGNDILIGQAANDTMMGGVGADRFNYNTGRSFSAADLGSDKVLDFRSGEQDKIVLGKTTFGLASAVGNGFSTTSEFAAVTTDLTAKGSTAKIIYSRETGNIFYNANGITVGGEGIVTTLSASLSITANDFIIEA